MFPKFAIPEVKKRIAIIGSVGVPANYGGFETLAHQLVTHLDEDYDLTVYCSARNYTEKPKSFGKARLRYLPLSANGYQSVPYDILSILHAMWRNDTLLVLGVAGALIMPIVRVLTRAHIIVHIDGIEWRRDKWKSFAKDFLRFSEKLAVKKAHTVVVDNPVLRTYVKRIHKRDATLIEYGADHVRTDIPNPVNGFAFLKAKYAFSVCRIVPENNIRTILDAFTEFDGFPLVLVGNWADSKYGEAIRERYSSHKNLHLLDPIWEQDRLDEIRKGCHVYVHGHSAGGTNPSLVEAMYLGLPVVAYDVGFNRATMEKGGLYFSNKDALVSTLNGLDSDSLVRIGSELKATAHRKYLWRTIANKYAELF